MCRAIQTLDGWAENKQFLCTAVFGMAMSVGAVAGFQRRGDSIGKRKSRRIASATL
jgi:hypothetical protein